MTRSSAALIVGDLVGEQPDVGGVQHRAHGRHREVGLEVLLVVPHVRADPLVAGDAQRREPVGELGGAGGDLGERRAPPRPALGLGHDLAAGVPLPAVANDGRHGQRAVHHRALHLSAG
jgi:hypothetical protein